MRHFMIGSLSVAWIIFLGASVDAYTIKSSVAPYPGNHEKSVVDACKHATKNTTMGEKSFPCLEDALVKGVREPDKQGLPLQMGFQRLFSQKGSRRDVSWPVSQFYF